MRLSSSMLKFFYQLVNSFEYQKDNQLWRQHQSTELPQLDPIEEFDDELPTI
ncbi:MAG: hypothetical protein KDI74_16205 [Gammaproteobacteria bacterium]|nr:hypothetical protein [Gammaproteobacteria bacterium]